MPNIFWGGWMLIMPVYRNHTGSSTWREGRRVGRGDILILGLWTGGRMISATLGPERLWGSLAGSQPFYFIFLFQHAFPI